MIEFKAECGHTVRARDEDAGGVVRCSYCGRDSAVPDSREEALDFLFDEVSAGDKGGGGRGGKRGRGFSLRRKPGRSGGFNPFPTIIRLCYFALLVSILIVVGQKFVRPLFQGDPPSARSLAAKKEAPPKRERGDRRSQTVSPNQMGLLSRDELIGMYVASTPPGATVFCVKTDSTPAEGRINGVPGCARFQTPGRSPRLANGTYTVELVLPWNDPHLKRYAGYTELRRGIEDADPDNRSVLLSDYFVPDEASTIFVDETADQKYLVRQYRDVLVRDGRSSGVRALFLPRGNHGEGKRVSVEDLVVNHIPNTVAYRFDEAHVLSELEYYEVAESDRPWVVKALARIGIMPYVTDARRTVVFKIGVEDGVFAARVVAPQRKRGK
jgi:hypothetical protein